MVEPSRAGLVVASSDVPTPVMFFGQVAADDQVEQAFDLGDGAMWAFYRQPMPRCAVAACARASQGAALRSRDVSLAHGGGLPLGSEAVLSSVRVRAEGGSLPRPPDRSTLGAQLGTKTARASAPLLDEEVKRAVHAGSCDVWKAATAVSSLDSSWAEELCRVRRCRPTSAVISL